MEQKENKLSLSHVKVPEASRETSGLRTIPQVLQYYAGKCPEKEAVVFVSTDGRREAVTFKEVYEKSKIVAHNLVTLGVEPKEVVAINLRTCPEWLYVTFGSMMAGALPLGASFTYKDGGDLIALMEKLKRCSCLVMDPGHEDENWKILSKLLEEYSVDGSVTSQQMPSLRYLLCRDPENKISGVKSLPELLEDTASKPSLPHLLENDISGLFQTSGSTGKPKVVAHTHASLLTLSDWVGDEILRTANYFCERPFGWVDGYPLSLFLGQTRITVSGFCPPPSDTTNFLIDVITKEKSQVLAMLPSILQKVKAKEEYGESWPVKSMVFGGQPIPKAAILPVIGRLCDNIRTIYAGTESLRICENFITDPEEFVEYSSGYTSPGVEVQIVDSEEKIVPVNTCGEIYVKGRTLFSSYFNDSEKTAAVFSEDGWYKTDDLGRMLEDGLLIVEGRKSNMIVCGTMNVAPEILEKLLLRCPGVESCILVPVPDDVMHQVICACIKAVPGSGVDETVLRKFCEDAHGDKLGLFTVLPKFYLFLNSFPETSTGKVSRKELAAMASDTFKKQHNAHAKV